MVPLRTVVPGALSHVIRLAPLTPEKVTFAWRVTVGAAVDKATSVHLDEAGVLHVKAESAAWAAAVRKSSSMIVTRLEQWLGPDIVRGLHFEP